MNSVRRHGALFGMFVFCAAFSIYNLALYRQDQQWIAAKAAEIVTKAGARTQQEQMHALSAFVRENVQFIGAPYDGRPFLRSSAKQTLLLGKGFCGEATRTFIALARARGIPAQRMNLHGPVLNHVVPEVELAGGRRVLVDIQKNPISNAVLDPQFKSIDEVVGAAGSPFVDYSNVNLRRIPGISLLVRRVKLESITVGWILENPTLMRGIASAMVAGILLCGWLADRLLIRWYSRRLGTVFVPYRQRA